jgi:hypothetical protein
MPEICKYVRPGKKTHKFTLCDNARIARKVAESAGTDSVVATTALALGVAPVINGTELTQAHIQDLYMDIVKTSDFIDTVMIFIPGSWFIKGAMYLIRKFLRPMAAISSVCLVIILRKYEIKVTESCGM